MWSAVRRLMLLAAAALFLDASAFAQATDDEGEYPNDLDRILSAWRTERALSEYTGGCDLPAASAREQIILLSAWGVRGVSNVTLTTQDVQYTVGDIAIERGREPIYLILVSGGPVVWRFSGATRRLRTLVIVASTPNGYTGARPRRFSAMPTQRCFGPFGERQHTSTRVAAGIVARELGREPDVVALQQHYEISIPAGVLTPSLPIDRDRPPPPAPAGFDEAVFRSAMVGELILLDPAHVRGAVARRYEVMPGWLGLAQLAGAGAIEAMPYADGWSNFRIRRSPLTLPPDTNFRRYTIRLYLPPGTPFPNGDLTGVCMVDEATGEWVGPIRAFCAERHAWMRRNIEENERFRRARD